MKFESYKGKVEIPEIINESRGAKPSNPVTLALIDWLKTDDKTFKVKCTSLDEATNAYRVVFKYRRRYKLDYTIYKRGLEVYCVRA